MSGQMTKTAYRAQVDAEAEAEWNVAHSANCTAADYRARIQMSGVWIAVVTKWQPELVEAYAEPRMTDAEVEAMKGITSNEEFGAWWSALLRARGGAAPVDLVARVVRNNLMRDVVDSYAEPTV